MIQKLLNTIRPTNNIKLVFIYGDKYKNSGSTIMRTFQLSKICKDQLPGYTVSAGSSSGKYKNAVLILSKGAIQSINEKSLALLKDRNNVLLFDVVDSILPDSKAIYADQVISASYGSYLQMQERYGVKKVSLIDHHVDPRIYNTSAHKFNSVNAGYFGELVNTIKSPALEKMVDYVLVDTSKKSSDWISKLPEYNLHVCVRNQDTDDTNKPFLKGFTAAHTHSSVIVHNEQNDAIRWLGDDYPYIITGKVTPKKIIDMVEQAKKDYGTIRWKLSQDKMEVLRNKTQYPFIIDQLAKAIKKGSDRDLVV